ncbi:O-fucosyltransferase 1-like isoform X15 [Diospyros lotus]|uniref:O-fucosyltransferase 1-like isoform X14 n=1 Tax=Diospyros lotus TaxID=55363 RepID=UPI0022519EA9|nr:O-fucosyltransferase 1-like isoform X14 [Diospyros lotus]XP_052174206.1 O-fucosyltransferase 1-like isoform X15 [Diospyros lotus]
MVMVMWRPASSAMSSIVLRPPLPAKSVKMALNTNIIISNPTKNENRKLPILLFDVMDTIVRDPFYQDVPAFFSVCIMRLESEYKRRMSLKELIDCKHPTAWMEFERGLINENELARIFFKDGRPLDLEGLKSCMQRGYSYIQGAEELLHDLKQNNYEIHAFTNYPIWYEMIEEKLKLSTYLSWSFCSCNTGILTDCSLGCMTQHLYLHIDTETLWETAASDGWRPSSAPRFDWPPPPKESNGHLRVRCNGGLNQQRSAICNAVLAARIMNATLVLPELDANSFWHDDSGFRGIYDVDHFIRALRFDVRIVESIPEIRKNGKTKKIKAHQLRPPRDAPISWYTTVALEKMKEHGAIYLTPFSHRLAEEIDNPEYQRLRCRVNYHALRFKPHIMKLSNSIVSKLRSEGHFMSIHLRFEMDMLAFAGCLDIFSPEEQRILMKYRKENFAEKRLVYSERRVIGKCPLTPEEVGLILHAMGFDNSTKIYLAAGELFGGERFMKPFRSMFPRLENHSTVDPSEEIAENTRGLVGSAVDYMVCLLSDIFMPTYDGPSNFANNLLGHRLYYGFRTTIRPDRKALAAIFIDREKGRTTGFNETVRRVMLQTNFGGPHKRVPPESFYTNSWPECFCQTSTQNPDDKCPPENVLEKLHRRLEGETTSDSDTLVQSNSTVSMADR